MKAEEFLILANRLEDMTPHQRGLVAERLRKIGRIQAVNTLIESRTLTPPVCPTCGHDPIAHWGSASGYNVTVAQHVRPHSMH
jgi:hypothetical protein